MIATSVTQKILHWCGALLLILSFTVLSYSPALFPNQIKQAEATLPTIDYTAIATAIYNAVESWIVEAAQSLYQWYLQYKEMVLDGLAWTVINVILEKMAQDIIKWINSGFKGRPAFVQNPEAYFIDIADKVVGDAIWKSGDFKFLCSPFALDIKLALELQYVNGRGPDYQYTSQCTLSNVIDNVQGFFDGDFLSSGWEGWMEVTTKPQNNPYGALALGSMHLSAQVGSKQEEKSQALAWGRGLMSSEVCNEVQDESGGHTECNTVTPGSAIQDQLSRTLSIPVERLTVADEFNEILNALFNQLVMKAFSEVGGLLGSTESNISGAPGTGTYYNDLEDTTRPIPSSEIESMTKAVAAENNYLTLIVGLLNAVNAAANYKNDTYGALACHSGALNPTLAAAKLDLESQVLEIQATIARLEAMIKEYTDLETDLTLTKQERLDRQIALVQEFAVMKPNLHDETSVAILKARDAKDIEEAIKNFKAEVDAACIFFGGGGGGP